MVRSMRVFAPLVFLLLTSIVAMVVEPAVTCSTVEDALSPCVTDVPPKGTVPENCCNGVKAIKDLGEADSKLACGCIKTDLVGAPPEILAFFLTLPSKCGVQLPYELGPSANCTSIVT